MTSLPRLEDLAAIEGGFDEQAVRDAFESFRRHAVQLQAQLRVLQAAGRSSQVEPSGHAVRMDALHLIREAAEFADVLERDAQNASAAQFSRTEQEVRQKQVDLQQREAEVLRFRDESDRQRNEIVTAARNEARQLVADANREATKELREAESRGARLLEQARHQATELTNATRAEVESDSRVGTVAGIGDHRPRPARVRADACRGRVGRSRGHRGRAGDRQVRRGRRGGELGVRIRPGTSLVRRRAAAETEQGLRAAPAPSNGDSGTPQPTAPKSEEQEPESPTLRLRRHEDVARSNLSAHAS